jgi:hypothetical protein
MADSFGLELGKKTEFVARWGKQGNKGLIAVPKQKHKELEKMTNPPKVTVEKI